MSKLTEYQELLIEALRMDGIQPIANEAADELERLYKLVDALARVEAQPDVAAAVAGEREAIEGNMDVKLEAMRIVIAGISAKAGVSESELMLLLEKAESACLRARLVA